MARPPGNKTAPAPNERGVYKVLTPVEHDGERFDVDDTIELIAAEAAGLIECKAIADTGERVAAPETAADPAA